MNEEERRRCCIIADGACCGAEPLSAESRDGERHRAMMEELLSYWPPSAGNPEPGVLRALADGLLKNFGFTTPMVAAAIVETYRPLFAESLQ